MDPFFHTGLSISDSLKTVRKSVLIYETIIFRPKSVETRKRIRTKIIAKTTVRNDVSVASGGGLFHFTQYYLHSFNTTTAVLTQN